MENFFFTNFTNMNTLNVVVFLEHLPISLVPAGRLRRTEGFAAFLALAQLLGALAAAILWLGDDVALPGAPATSTGH